MGFGKPPVQAVDLKLPVQAAGAQPLVQRPNAILRAGLSVPIAGLKLPVQKLNAALRAGLPLYRRAA